MLKINIIIKRMIDLFISFAIAGSICYVVSGKKDNQI